MTNELWKLDATAQAQLVRQGEVTALDLVDAAIARIEALDPELNTLSTKGFDRARERAKTEPEGPFGGVPFLLKDSTAYPGLRHAMGSRLFASNVPVEGTPYSQALDAAGLVVLGKTTMSEIGLLGSTETLLDGITHNPWDLERSSGGSSGGSAAAVAARLVPFAHGSDGGGSIRLPAAMNGVFGFKPSSRRMLPCMPDDMHGLVVDHCLSWSVRDSARLLSLTEKTDDAVGFVAGPDSKRLRIGVYTRTLMGHEPEGPQRAALEKTIQLCRELGHEVISAKAPPADGQEIGEAFFTIAGSVLDSMEQMMLPMFGRPLGDAELEPFTLELLDWYRARPSSAMDDALATIDRVTASMADYLAQYDATLCPSIPVDLLPLGTLAPTLSFDELISRTEKLAAYTPVHNMAGAPAMSVPLHQSDEGWPLGAHFAASPGAERRLLALAYELEEAAPWRDRLPPIAIRDSASQ